MRNARINTFETNSSSVHSIVLTNKNINDLEVASDGYVHISLPYYGKQFRKYANSYDKLCYLVLVAAYSNGIYMSFDAPASFEESLSDSLADYEDAYESEMNYFIDSCNDLRDTSAYRLIEECVKDELTTHDVICKGIKIHANECGIDHQSQDCGSIYEFLEKHKIGTVRDFIFGPVALQTDCD